MLQVEQELVFENNKIRMFDIFESKLLTRHCQCKDSNNIELKDYRCAYVMFKYDTPAEYVLMNEHGHIIASDESYTRMANHIDLLKSLRIVK